MQSTHRGGKVDLQNFFLTYYIRAMFFLRLFNYGHKYFCDGTQHEAIFNNNDVRQGVASRCFITKFRKSCNAVF